jgi:hypothetical protein
MQQPTSTPALTPPQSPIKLDKARQRFGKQKVDLLITLTYCSDDLADALIEECDELGLEAKHKLNLGISQGLQQVDVPSPALRAFLEEVEYFPDWVDLERIKRGSEAALSIGQLWTLLALGPGALTHTYSFPSIARVLLQTGDLTKMARRRLMETGAWYIASVLPGGLLRGADGYIHSVQVRLLHARIRTTLLKGGWDIQAMGRPINQLEMTRTWLDFTYVPFSALQKFGIVFTQDELHDLYHFWGYIAYLMGVDERLYRPITDQQRAQELLELIDSTSEGANEDSKVLTQAMLKAVSELLQKHLKVSASIRYNLASALTRHLHGDELADQLGIKRTWLSMIMPLITWINCGKRAWDLRSPATRARAVARTVKAFQQIPPQSTAYQRNASTSS